jgi:hypothetical protein
MRLGSEIRGDSGRIKESQVRKIKILIEPGKKA